MTTPIRSESPPLPAPQLLARVSPAAPAPLDLGIMSFFVSGTAVSYRVTVMGLTADGDPAALPHVEEATKRAAFKALEHAVGNQFSTAAEFNVNYPNIRTIDRNRVSYQSGDSTPLSNSPRNFDIKHNIEQTAFSRFREFEDLILGRCGSRIEEHPRISEGTSPIAMAAAGEIRPPRDRVESVTPTRFTPPGAYDPSLRRSTSAARVRRTLSPLPPIGPSPDLDRVRVCMSPLVQREGTPSESDTDHADVEGHLMLEKGSPARGGSPQGISPIQRGRRLAGHLVRSGLHATVSLLRWPVRTTIQRLRAAEDSEDSTDEVDCDGEAPSPTTPLTAAGTPSLPVVGQTEAERAAQIAREEAVRVRSASARDAEDTGRPS
jgi:hypothetical protein